mmetsp:Transcript_31918/g.109761  ORF Transcript_31918/g.109761 Transcript_31918/m.109761 type:complete len:258 (+) Transcript_31918:353-1126(+)
MAGSAADAASVSVAAKDMYGDRGNVSKTRSASSRATIGATGRHHSLYLTTFSLSLLSKVRGYAKSERWPRARGPNSARPRAMPIKPSSKARLWASSSIDAFRTLKVPFNTQGCSKASTSSRSKSSGPAYCSGWCLEGGKTCHAAPTERPPSFGEEGTWTRVANRFSISEFARTFKAHPPTSTMPSYAPSYKPFKTPLASSPRAWTTSNSKALCSVAARSRSLVVPTSSDGKRRQMSWASRPRCQSWLGSSLPRKTWS